MVHYSKLLKIVIDVPAAEHDRELAFWSAATGQQLARFGRHPEYHGAALHGQDLWLRQVMRDPAGLLFCSATRGVSAGCGQMRTRTTMHHTIDTGIAHDVIIHAWWTHL